MATKSKCTICGYAESFLWPAAGTDRESGSWICDDCRDWVRQ